MPARHGNFVRDPFEFDYDFFNISPREAKSMDPQQKLLLQGAVRALDDAGYVPDMSPSFKSESMGCYIGVATQDYAQNLASEIDVYYSTGKYYEAIHVFPALIFVRHPSSFSERKDFIRIWLEWPFHCR